MQKIIFLTAEWRNLLMLNYAVDAGILRPFVPDGTELDTYDGTHFVSVVGFQFNHVRIFGVPIPMHTNFEEVNLRFYVRHKTATGWRRGVVFIRELVPRRAIAFIARTFYGEPYTALPMRHHIALTDQGICVDYAWKRSGKWESIKAKGRGLALPIAVGSEEEFITEHYWGYTKRESGTQEYEVEHPRWQVWRAHEARLDADVAGLYGDRFAESLSKPTSSAFIAEGSRVVVRWGSSTMS